MKIGITGVTGLIGRTVAKIARERGHEVVGFAREPEKVGPGTRHFSTDEVPDVSGCDAILNLAGASVAGLWTAKRKKAIRESRILSTRRIVEAMRAAKEPPGVLVNGSAIGIYGSTPDSGVTEDGPHGNEFLAEVCEAWEAEALAARETGARVALLRTAVVLARDGGALPVMLPAFRAGLGGKLGNGRQWFSWIHIDDEAALALSILESAVFEGPVNAAAPNAVTNADYTKALAARLHRPAFFNVPAFALRAALDGFAAELLDSRRVVPGSAEKAGFVFRYPDIDGALQDLLGA